MKSHLSLKFYGKIIFFFYYNSFYLNLLFYDYLFLNLNNLLNVLFYEHETYETNITNNEEYFFL